MSRARDTDIKPGWFQPSAAETARAVLIPYVLSRLLVGAALLLTRHLVDELAVTPRPLAAHDGLLAWDASWYADIARAGYDPLPPEGLRFFPLFPLLARALAVLPAVDTDLALLLVANGAALAFGAALYRLAWSERRDDTFARRAVWIAYLAPPAFVLVMGYAESTLMLLSAVALLALRRRMFWVAAAVGVLAGLTRPVGVLLVVPALVEALAHRRDLLRRDIAARVAAVAAPVVGLFTYLAWACDRTDDFFFPLRVQEDPSRRGDARFPVTNVIDTARDFVSGDTPTAGLHLATALVMVVLVVVLARRWPPSFTAYAAAVAVVGLTASNLDSLERYSLSTLPFVLAAADVSGGENRERVVLTVSVAALVAFSVLAFSGELVP
ncbi:MAG: hypothetical protein ACT4OX_00030 [Actinomycetota bacterium]